MGAGASARSAKKLPQEGSSAEEGSSAALAAVKELREEGSSPLKKEGPDANEVPESRLSQPAEQDHSNSIAVIDKRQQLSCSCPSSSEGANTYQSENSKNLTERRDAHFKAKSYTQRTIEEDREQSSLLAISPTYAAAKQRARAFQDASTPKHKRPLAKAKTAHGHDGQAGSWLSPPSNQHDQMIPELAHVVKKRDGALTITKLSSEEDLSVWAISVTGASIVMAAAASALNSNGIYVSRFTASKMVARSSERGTVEEWDVSSSKPILVARQQGYLPGDRVHGFSDGTWNIATVRDVAKDGTCTIIWEETGRKEKTSIDALRRANYPEIQIDEGEDEAEEEEFRESQQPAIELDASHDTRINDPAKEVSPALESCEELTATEDEPQGDPCAAEQQEPCEALAPIVQEGQSDECTRDDPTALPAPCEGLVSSTDEPPNDPCPGKDPTAMQEDCAALALITEEGETAQPFPSHQEPAMEMTLQPAALGSPTLKTFSHSDLALTVLEGGFHLGESVECLSPSAIWQKASIQKNHFDGNFTVKWEKVRGFNILPSDKIRRVEKPKDMISHGFNVTGAEKPEKECMGNFFTIAEVPTGSNYGGKPVYTNLMGSYLYYWAPKSRWVIAYGSFEDGDGAVVSKDDAPCPTMVRGWTVWYHTSWSSAFRVTVTSIAEAHPMSDRYRTGTKVSVYDRIGHITSLKGKDKDNPFVVSFEDELMPQETRCGAHRIMLEGESGWTPVDSSPSVGCDSCFRSFAVGSAEVFSAAPACYASWKVTASNASQRTLGLSLGEGPAAKPRFAVTVEDGNVIRVHSSLEMEPPSRGLSRSSSKASFSAPRKASKLSVVPPVAYGTAMPGDIFAIEHAAGNIHFIRNGKAFKQIEFHFEPDQHLHAYASIHGAHGEMCDLSCKYHAKRTIDDVAEDIQCKGLSVRQLLQFCVAKCISKHTLSSDVVVDILIPESAGGKVCYMDTSFMEELGGPHRAHKMVSHAWKAPFLSTVLNILLDAAEISIASLKMQLNVPDHSDLAVELTGAARLKVSDKKEYGKGLSKFSSIFPSRALEMLDSNVLDKTYWLCMFAVNQHEALCGDCWECFPKTGAEFMSPTCSCGRVKRYPCKCGLINYKAGDLECIFDKWALVMSKMDGVVISLDPKLMALSRLWATTEIGEARRLPHTTVRFQTPTLTDRMIMKLRRRIQKSPLLPLVAKLEVAEVSNPSDKDFILAGIREGSLNPEIEEHAFNDFVQCMVELSFGICHSLADLESLHANPLASLSHCLGAKEALESLERLEMQCGWAIHITNPVDLGLGHQMHKLVGLQELTLNLEGLQLIQTEEMWSELAQLKSLIFLELNLTKLMEKKNEKAKPSHIIDGIALGKGIGGLSSLQHLLLILEDVEIHGRRDKGIFELTAGICQLTDLVTLDLSLQNTLTSAKELGGLQELASAKTIQQLNLNLAGSRLTDATAIVEAIVQLPDLVSVSLNLRNTRAGTDDLRPLAAYEDEDFELYVVLPDGIEVNSPARMQEVLQEPVGEYNKRFAGNLAFWCKKSTDVELRGGMQAGWGRGWAVANVGVLPGMVARWKVRLSEEFGEKFQVLGVVSGKKQQWHGDLHSDIFKDPEHWVAAQAPTDVNHYVFAGVKKVAYIFSPGDVVQLELNRNTHQLTIEGEQGSQNMIVPAQGALYPAACFQNEHQHVELIEYSEENRQDLIRDSICEAIESEDIKQLQDTLSECERCGFVANELQEARAMKCYLERGLAALSLLAEAMDAGDMLSLHAAIIEGQRSMLLFKEFKPPSDEESLQDDDEKPVTRIGQGHRIRAALVVEIEKAQSLLQGLGHKVEDLDQLEEAIASRDIPTLKTAIEKVADQTTYTLCEESRAALQIAQSDLNKWEQRMEKLHRCFFIGHELRVLGVKRSDGWECAGFQGGCKSGITGRFQTNGMERFQCRECNYDLCKKCLDGWTAHQEKQNLIASYSPSAED